MSEELKENDGTKAANFQWAAAALMNGLRVRATDWPRSVYIQRVDGKLVDQRGDPVTSLLLHDQFDSTWVPWEHPVGCYGSVEKLVKLHDMATKRGWKYVIERISHDYEWLVRIDAGPAEGLFGEHAILENAIDQVLAGADAYLGMIERNAE